MPPVTDYNTAYGSLSGVYDPQTSLVNQQIQDLQPQQDAAQASLDQAKVNAFKDITDQSNQRGVLFSGVPIDQQSTYVGTKYLPAVANLKATYQNNKNTLLDKINQINATRATQAQGIVSDSESAAAKVQAALIKANSGGSSKPTTQDYVSSLFGQLGTRTGKDGYISPQDYARGMAAWVQEGLKPSDYDDYFSSFRNPKNGAYLLSSGKYSGQK